ALQILELGSLTICSSVGTRWNRRPMFTLRLGWAGDMTQSMKTDLRGMAQLKATTKRAESIRSSPERHFNRRMELTSTAYGTEPESRHTKLLLNHFRRG